MDYNEEKNIRNLGWCWIQPLYDELIDSPKAYKFAERLRAFAFDFPKGQGRYGRGRVENQRCAFCKYFHCGFEEEDLPSCDKGCLPRVTTDYAVLLQPNYCEKFKENSDEIK